MSHPTKPVVLVTGATGAQGGGVARHLLSRGRFAVRALTRRPGSDAAQALRQAGAEVVEGDLDDVASLRAALDGCYGAFGVTNYWQHFAHEYEQGRNLVDAVAESDIRHFVFSTLPYVKRITGGELAVEHFDLKGMMEDHARERDLPVTFVHLAYYFENFLNFFAPRPKGDGTYTFGFPQGDTPLAGVTVEDAGGIVARMLERRDEFIGKTLYIVGDDLPAADYAAIMTRVLGRQVTYEHIPRDVFASFDFPGAADTANMFEFYRAYVPNRRAELEQSRAIYPDMQDFPTWFERHREQFLAVMEG